MYISQQPHSQSDHNQLMVADIIERTMQGLHNMYVTFNFDNI